MPTHFAFRTVGRDWSSRIFTKNYTFVQTHQVLHLVKIVLKSLGKLTENCANFRFKWFSIGFTFRSSLRDNARHSYRFWELRSSFWNAMELERKCGKHIFSRWVLEFNISTKLSHTQISNCVARNRYECFCFYQIQRNFRSWKFVCRACSL